MTQAEHQQNQNYKENSSYGIQNMQFNNLKKKKKNLNFILIYSQMRYMYFVTHYTTLSHWSQEKMNWNNFLILFSISLPYESLCPELVAENISRWNQKFLK